MKLRVIAGKYKGRQIDAPHGHTTHPMGEKVRGALFNMLGDIKGLNVLDAFAGSGSVAIEAISRGARHATAVDNDKSAYQTMTSNVEILDAADQLTVVQANVGSWVKRGNISKFDVVIVDSPYDKVLYLSLQKIAYAAKINAVVVYSLPTDHDFSLPKSEFTKLSEKNYAGAALVFYRRLR